MVIDHRAPANIIAELTRLMLTPPIGLRDPADDYHSQVSSAMRDKGLGNETSGRMKPSIVQDIKLFHKAMPIFNEEHRPTTATPVPF